MEEWTWLSLANTSLGHPLLKKRRQQTSEPARDHYHDTCSCSRGAINTIDTKRRGGLYENKIEIEREIGREM